MSPLTGLGVNIIGDCYRHAAPPGLSHALCLLAFNCLLPSACFPQFFLTTCPPRLQNGRSYSRRHVSRVTVFLFDSPPRRTSRATTEGRSVPACLLTASLREKTR